jgi:hypothetical protein
MTLNTASLSAHAQAAMTQYNADLKAGGEPVFPEWAGELVRLIDARDKLEQAMREIRSLALMQAKQNTTTTVICDIVESAFVAAGVAGAAGAFKPQLNVLGGKK